MRIEKDAELGIETELGRITIRASEAIPEGAWITTQNQPDGSVVVGYYENGRMLEGMIPVGSYDWAEVVRKWDKGQ